MLANGAVAAVLGKPVEHSLSPVLHAAAYKVLGLDWSFDKHVVGNGELSEFLSTTPMNLAGYALTMPLKDEAFAVAAEVDTYAAMALAVNTLIPRGNEWLGYNTDVVGFLNSMMDVADPINPVVIGAGATARSAVAALELMGAEHIRIMARREAAITDIAETFPDLNIVGLEFSPTPVDADLVISTLPAGIADTVELGFSVGTLYDVIYAPWPTVLARKAQTSGVTVLGGLDLLVAQAVEQVILMTQCDEVRRDELFDVMMSAGLTVQIERSRLD
jgi:shikimate dehydrogenase